MPGAAPPLAADELRLLWFAHGRDQGSRRERLDHLLRTVLAPLVDSAPAALRFGREPKGRPFLRHDRAPDFNLSDTRGGTVLALAAGPGRIGVDLERTDRRPPALPLARRWFSLEEQAALAAIAEPSRPLAFLRLWTAKEATCKATGTGIFGYLDRWRFDAAAEQPRLLDWPKQEGPPARWQHLRLAPASGYTAVVALRDSAPRRLAVFSAQLD